MLHLIYPHGKKITDESAEYILKLGDRFQITNLIDDAEEVLTKSVSLSIPEKLRLADKYRLEGLLTKCLSALKKTRDIQKIKDSPIYKDLSSDMKVTLLERMLEIVK
ncbi:hypothetical protein PENTCL1PPCAC_1292 [Pristionchus entomophagus]|uniref:BTB domain-containing protein n=1 Tax=Pristionchus entomophagus TaxID=358040 RepID=A0AAV5S9H7_9BILA|nr:hypothetical protein PENTCL1PPCAC_1292 [Pristionchus entomophagus]